MFTWVKRLLCIDAHEVVPDDYWQRRREASDARFAQQRNEMKERYARQSFAAMQSAGIIVTDDSSFDGIRYGDLQQP